eukprot:scaffold10719_cov101-Isochrysis_galbana.AAC.3
MQGRPAVRGEGHVAGRRGGGRPGASAGGPARRRARTPSTAAPSRPSAPITDGAGWPDRANAHAMDAMSRGEHSPRRNEAARATSSNTAGGRRSARASAWATVAMFCMFQSYGRTFSSRAMTISNTSHSSGHPSPRSPSRLSACTMLASDHAPHPLASLAVCSRSAHKRAPPSCDI